MPRFALLTHDHPFLHWDLLLEDGDFCLTWRLLQSPDRAGLLSAEKRPNHRPLYLDYEGVVSEDRGRVSQWDAGTFDWRRRQDDNLEIEIAGRRLRGRLTLCRTSGDAWNCQVQSESTVSELGQNVRAPGDETPAGSSPVESHPETPRNPA